MSDCIVCVEHTSVTTITIPCNVQHCCRHSKMSGIQSVVVRRTMYEVLK